MVRDYSPIIIEHKNFTTSHTTIFKPNFGHKNKVTNLGLLQLCL